MPFELLRLSEVDPVVGLEQCDDYFEVTHRGFVVVLGLNEVFWVVLGVSCIRYHFGDLLVRLFEEVGKDNRDTNAFRAPGGLFEFVFEPMQLFQVIVDRLLLLSWNRGLTLRSCWIFGVRRQ